MQFMDINIIRSNRKTISIQINPDLTVTVRAPKRASLKEINRCLQENEAWIAKHIEKMRIRNEEKEQFKPEPFTNAEIKEIASKALQYIPDRVKYFAPIVGVDYGRITIRKQKSRWGSCSSKGNLNFNCLLMLAPSEVIDYVIVHELCHRKEMNHSKAFWNEVERVIPDYKELRKWLRVEGSKIIER